MANGTLPSKHEVRFWGVKECAQYLRIHPKTFYRMMKSKNKNGPPRKKIGKQWRIPVEEFIQWIGS